MATMKVDKHVPVKVCDAIRRFGFYASEGGGRGVLCGARDCFSDGIDAL